MHTKRSSGDRCQKIQKIQKNEVKREKAKIGGRIKTYWVETSDGQQIDQSMKMGREQG